MIQCRCSFQIFENLWNNFVRNWCVAGRHCFGYIFFYCIEEAREESECHISLSRSKWENGIVQKCDIYDGEGSELKTIASREIPYLNWHHISMADRNTYYEELIAVFFRRWCQQWMMFPQQFPKILPITLSSTGESSLNHWHKPHYNHRGIDTSNNTPGTVPSLLTHCHWRIQGGGAQGHADPLLHLHFFIFTHFRKNWPNNRLAPLWGWHPLSGKSWIRRCNCLSTFYRKQIQSTNIRKTFIA